MKSLKTANYSDKTVSGLGIAFSAIIAAFVIGLFIVTSSHNRTAEEIEIILNNVDSTIVPISEKDPATLSPLEKLFTLTGDMYTFEVRKVMGPPNRAVRYQDSEQDYLLETWRYGNDIIIFFHDGKFHRWTFDEILEGIATSQ